MEQQRDRRWTLVAVCATTFMLLVDITIVNVALPSIQRQLHAGLTGLQWAVSSTGTQVAHGHSQLAHAATVAFVSGLNTVLLIACGVAAVGALAAGALVQVKPMPTPAQAVLTTAEDPSRAEGSA